MEEIKVGDIVVVKFADRSSHGETINFGIVTSIVTTSDSNGTKTLYILQNGVGFRREEIIEKVLTTTVKV